MYVYTLKLQSGKYYIGTTHDIGKRIIQHKSGNGSVWTRQYKFECLIDLYEADDELALFEETKQVCKCFLQYGPENVRGAQYCQLSQPSIEELIGYIGHNLKLEYAEVRKHLTKNFKKEEIEKYKKKSQNTLENKEITKESTEESTEENTQEEIDKQFAEACSIGKIEDVNRLLKIGIVDIGWGLNRASEEGNVDIIDRLIEFATENNLNTSLYCACKYGQIHAINRLIEYGASDFNHGLTGAYVGKKKDIINKMIELGAKL
jgi:hypothetical protein